MRLLILAAVALAGCVHSTRFQGPAGEEMVEVRCGGLASIGDCYTRAREECGGDFRVDEKREGVEYIAQANNYGASVTPVATRQITVVCQPWRGSQPEAAPASAPAVGPSLGSAKGAPGACSSDADCVRGQHCYTGSGSAGLCMAD